eukprot:2900958-Rhodomonas_salina.1
MRDGDGGWSCFRVREEVAACNTIGRVESFCCGGCYWWLCVSVCVVWCVPEQYRESEERKGGLDGRTRRVRGSRRGEVWESSRVEDKAERRERGDCEWRGVLVPEPRRERKGEREGDSRLSSSTSRGEEGRERRVH